MYVQNVRLAERLDIKDNGRQDNRSSTVDE